MTIRVKTRDKPNAGFSFNITYREVDHHADRMRVTTVPYGGDSGAGQLLELLDSDGEPVAAYPPGQWFSAYVLEGATAVELPSTITEGVRA